MSFNLKNKAITERSIDTAELSIALFVILSFTVQFFSHILASNSLLIIVLLLLSILIISLNAHKTKTYLMSSFLWLAAFVIIAISIFRPTSYISGFSINKYVDIFVLFAGVNLLAFCGHDSGNFHSSAKIILIFALFYGISVWFQIIFPSSYNIFLRHLPESSARNILRGSMSRQYFTGFTSNAGFTAGYIMSGIILLLSKSKNIIQGRG